MSNKKTILVSLVITLVPLFIMLCSGYSQWLLFDHFRLTKEESISLYISIYIIVLILHLILHVEECGWKHVFVIGLAPTGFFFSCSIQVLVSVLSIGACIYFYVTFCTLRLIRDDEDLEQLQDGTEEQVKAFLYQKTIHDNILGFIAYVTIVSILSFTMSHTNIRLDSNYGESYYKRLKKSEEAVIIPTNSRDLISTEEGHSWEENKELLMELNQELYPQKTTEERLSAWQPVVSIECSYLGIPEISIDSKKMDDEVLGSFDPHDRLIYLNKFLLEDDEGQVRILYTILHEVYHYYQYMCVQEWKKIKDDVNADLLFARDIKAWAEEFAPGGYQRSEGDFKSYAQYRMQATETSACKHAEEWAGQYWLFIQGTNTLQRTLD